MKKILLIATGGTIACARSEDGLRPVLTSDELLKFVPKAGQLCEIHTVQLMNIDSTNIHPNHWLCMKEEIQKNYNDYDGFVICHGTDTMAYTAAALSYLIQNSPRPIVITGAQKPIDMETTDAKNNLTDSILFALDDRSHDVVIVFDGKVIAGTRAKKERTKSYNAFSSINFPYIAVIQDEHIVFYIDDKDKMQSGKMPVFAECLDQKIGLLKLIPSMNPEILRTMAEYCDALIIESFGVGGLPTSENGDFKEEVRRLTAAGKVVAMTTQVTNEGSNMSVYEVGKNIKQELGLLEAYDMTLEATVTKLMWILGLTKRSEEIRRLFYQKVNQDMYFSSQW